jgi:predicted nucleic acid-binding protein
LTLYLDASVLLPMIVDEGTSDAVDALMERIDNPPIVGEFAAGEVASALSRLVRMKHLDTSDVRARLSDFDAWRASDAVLQDVEAADIRLAAVFVRRIELGLKMPDAIHAAMCRRLGHTLVTLDVRLAGAAAALGIEILIPS